MQKRYKSPLVIVKKIDNTDIVTASPISADRIDGWSWGISDTNNFEGGAYDE